MGESGNFIPAAEEGTDHKTAKQAADDSAAQGNQHLDRVVEGEGCQQEAGNSRIRHAGYGLLALGHFHAE